MKMKNEPRIDPGNPLCPVCGEQMGFDMKHNGIYYHEAVFKIPIICPKCGLELIFKAFPMGVDCERKHADKIKGLIP